MYINRNTHIDIYVYIYIHTRVSTFVSKPLPILHRALLTRICIVHALALHKATLPLYPLEGRRQRQILALKLGCC